MASVIRGDDNFDSKPYATFPVGVPFEIWDHLAAILLPDNTGPIKFIRLTAGQSGVGGYNEGLLTDEQVSGSAPLVEADAEIAVGPMAGQRVPLINTEMSFIRPGTDSGALQFDQMRTHSHRFGSEGAAGVGDRVIIRGNNNSITRAATDAAAKFVSNGNQDFSAVAGGTDQRTFMGNEVRSKNRQATYYMRIV